VYVYISACERECVCMCTRARFSGIAILRRAPTCLASRKFSSQIIATHCNMLQHAATRCNTLQLVYRTPTCLASCALQTRVAVCCGVLQCVAVRSSVLQLFFVRNSCLSHSDLSRKSWILITNNCNTLQHTATHCNTLQHTATHCNTSFESLASRALCVAVCCSVLQRDLSAELRLVSQVAPALFQEQMAKFDKQVWVNFFDMNFFERDFRDNISNVALSKLALQCVAACCSVLQLFVMRISGVLLSRSRNSCAHSFEEKWRGKKGSIKKRPWKNIKKNWPRINIKKDILQLFCQSRSQCFLKLIRG